MRQVRWSLLKSERLKRTRGASFEDILQSRLVAVLRHPRKPNQHIMLFEHRGYIWVVPCVVSSHEVFLKTLFQSRKYTKLYKRGELS